MKIETIYPLDEGEVLGIVEVPVDQKTPEPSAKRFYTKGKFIPTSGENLELFTGGRCRLFTDGYMSGHRVRARGSVLIDALARIGSSSPRAVDEIPPIYRVALALDSFNKR
ncbi:hypothetical protein HYW29_01415 [Candidatus Amesbacteria bacterium]|nr:hypothetical protein [Candidatus Amesbacteria bacterium]